MSGLTKCSKCGETYGRHRSAMCRIDDKLHTWRTVTARPDEGDNEAQVIKNCSFAEYQLEHQFTDHEPNAADYFRGYEDGYKDAEFDVSKQLAAERTRREAFEKMIAQAYRIEFTDYQRVIEKYGDENSKTGIVWQIEDEDGNKFSNHETALEAFQQLQESTLPIIR